MSLCSSRQRKGRCSSSPRICESCRMGSARQVLLRFSRKASDSERRIVIRCCSGTRRRTAVARIDSAIALASSTSCRNQVAMCYPPPDVDPKPRQNAVSHSVKPVTRGPRYRPQGRLLEPHLPPLDRLEVAQPRFRQLLSDRVVQRGRGRYRERRPVLPPEVHEPVQVPDL